MAGAKGERRRDGGGGGMLTERKRKAPMENNANGDTSKKPRKSTINAPPPPSSDDDFPKLMTRSTPKELLRAMMKFNHHQRESVKEMGFGSLLQLKVNGTPCQLGYWLVENYDARDKTLMLPKGKAISVTPADVAAVMGFPNGVVKMTRKRKSDVGVVEDLNTEWRVLFGKLTSDITVKEVCSAMLNELEGGRWFKIHFAILVVTTLIESLQNGYVNHNYIHNFADVGRINQLNWCQFVVKSLMASKLSWEENRSRKFTGPILFLTVLYADRIVLFDRTIPRSAPAFIGWTSRLLRKREVTDIKNKGFGFGQVEGLLQTAERLVDEVPSLPEAGLQVHINKTPPTIVNLSSHAMRAMHEQSAAEFASNKKMKYEGKSVCSQNVFFNRRKISHNKTGKPSIKKGNTQTSKPSTHREPPLGKTMVKYVPVALYSSKPSVDTVVQEKADKGMSVLDDDTPSTPSFTSDEEVETTMPALAETGGKSSVSSAISDVPIKLDNVEDFLAKLETQIKKAQSLSFSACHSPPPDNELSALNTPSPLSPQMLAKAKDDIARFLLMPFQDVLAPENLSTLNSALSTSGLSIDDTTFVLKKLKTSLPDLISSFRRAKRDQEEFYMKSAKKVLLVDELKKGLELYHDLKDNHDKLDSAMDSIKNQIKELKRSWKDAKMKKNAIQVQKLSLAKDCFTKCSALDEMESDLPAVEQKKELADSDIARVEASWADFKHKLMESQP